MQRFSALTTSALILAAPSFFCGALLATSGSAQAPHANAAVEAAALPNHQLSNHQFDSSRAATDRILRALAAKKIEAALEDAHSNLKSLRAAAADAAATLEDSSLIAIQLRDLATNHAHTEDRVDRTLESLASDLAFEPLAEAPFAEGWPPTAPIGDVVLKRYPEYRMATAEMPRSSEGGAFWKLFQHIQSNDIPMTAPVQMDKTDGDGGEPRMAFLYENTRVGKTGPSGMVEVVDIAPTFAISMGARGYRNRKAIDKLESQLEAWLAEHGKEMGVRANGSARVMGYNGPSVGGKRRFYEVEIPVVAITADHATPKTTHKVVNN